MKRLLIVTYHFPPDAAIGAVRSAKFAKYLPQFGWTPMVYTVKENQYERCDEGKFDSTLQAVKVYRGALIPGPLELYSRIRTGANSTRSVEGPEAPSRGRLDFNRTPSMRRFISSLLRLPDDRQGWILNVVLDGYRILKRHGIDILMTSGPPMSTHIGGLLLKRITGIRWVADFRDPWTAHNWKNERFRSAVCDAVEKRIESRVVHKADLIVSTASRVTRHFQSLLPPAQEGKCVTITNGYDDTDFPPIEPAVRGGASKIRISHAGSLYVGRNPEPFFAALRKLAAGRHASEEQVEIELIGDCATYNNVSVSELVRHYGLQSMVKLVGKMPFKACVERLMSSHVLLLFAQGFPEQIPAKVFEYLRIGKPIFAIVDEGDAKDILKPFPHVIFADPDDIDAIAEKIRHLLATLQRPNEYPVVSVPIERYNRVNLTKTLAQHLENLYEFGTSHSKD